MNRLRTLTVITAALAASLLTAPAHAADTAHDPPRTGFEKTHGARWTSQPEEQALLAAADRASGRVTVGRIGTTKQDRPLQPRDDRQALRPEQGAPRVQPARRRAFRPRGMPAHRPGPGLRDGPADPAVPVPHHRAGRRPPANPDGRAADTRGNSDGVDINRDHPRPEDGRGPRPGRRRPRPAPRRPLRPARVRLHTPYYDKDLFDLWPRNLNTHTQVHDEARTLSGAYVRPAAERV